ncbi:30S ribosomal protein S7 [Candidatus Microgenomates bacterium]|nr:30S ribosomal protein S7 [Candidatus Microgenomates bacterium]
MPRKGAVPVRVVEPDAVYSNRMVTKLINRLMIDGKKSVAMTQVYDAFQLIGKETGEEPLKVFLQALEQIKPVVEVRPRRVGGAAYQVPMPVRGPRRESLAIRWLLTAAKAKSNKEFHTFAGKIAREIVDAAHGEGGAVSKKREVERIAENNRAFAHFRW